MLNEDQIIKGCRNKSEKARKALYQMYSEAMRGICRRYTSNVSDAEDIMQEGFIKVFKHIKQFRGQGSLGGWIKRIMINTAISILRKKSKLVFSNDFDNLNFSASTTDNYKVEPDINPQNVKATIESAELSRKEILEAVQLLPDGYRTVFNLYAIENYKHREIAEMLGIDTNTSKSQLARARKHLQNLLYDIAIAKAKEYYKKELLARTDNRTS